MGSLCQALAALAICCYAVTPASAQQLSEENWISWLEKALVRTDQESVLFTVQNDPSQLVVGQPRAFAVYIDTPSWTSASIGLRIAQTQSQCLASAIRWTSVVSGVDYVPSSLESTVGYRGTVTSAWSAHVTVQDTLQLQPAPAPDAKASNSIAGKTEAVRNVLALEPFRRPPYFVSRKNPHTSFPDASTNTAQLNNVKVFQIPPDSATKALSDRGFVKTLRPAGGEARTFDSCYVTQTIVYVFYDGSCNNALTGSTLEVYGGYTAYNKCSQGWQFKLGRALEIVVIAVGVPMAVVLFVLTMPTLWRLISRPFILTWLWCLPEQKQDLKLKQHIRMESDQPERWQWWAQCQHSSLMRPVLAFRKRIVYAITTIDSLDGHSRLLQVMLVTACTVSVTVMVWRPSIQVVLGSSPLSIALQIADASGPLAALGRYLQIVALSLFLGCLGYLSTLANINNPGNVYWPTQRVISILSITYLDIILVIQLINLAALTPEMRDKGAYVWIVIIQAANIALGCVMQVLVVSKLHKRRVLYMPSLKPHASVQSAAQLTRPAAESIPPAPASSNLGKITGQHVVDIKAEIKHPRAPKPPGDTWWQRLTRWLQLSVLEESQEVTNRKTGRLLRIKTFKYPSWFIAAVLVALYMLVFHFAKSLSWAENWGNCIINPDLCQSSEFVQKWASVINSNQLAVVHAAYSSLRTQLSALAASEDAVNQILTANGGQPLDKWIAAADQVDAVLQPHTSEWEDWKDRYGVLLKDVSIFGFTLGFILGLSTLFQALRSYKAISRRHRVMRILNRLKALQGHAHSKAGQDSRPGADIVLSGAGKSAMLQEADKQAETVNTLVAAHAAITLTSSVRPNHQEPAQHSTAQDNKQIVTDAEEFATSQEHSLGQLGSSSSPIFSVTSIAAMRSLAAPIAPVVMFMGVLLSSTVVQLYAVGTLLSCALAFLFHQAFWTVLVARYWPYVVIAILIIILNRVFLLSWVGDTYLSNGHKISRPAGFSAYLIIVSITNLVLGLILAIIRLVVLLLTTIFTIGMLDRSILTVVSQLDLPYQSFLAGVHLSNTVVDLHDPAIRPGPAGRAVKRWRAAGRALVKLGPGGYQELCQRRAQSFAARPQAYNSAFIIPDSGMVRTNDSKVSMQSAPQASQTNPPAVVSPSNQSPFTTAATVRPVTGAFRPQ